MGRQWIKTIRVIALLAVTLVFTLYPSPVALAGDFAQWVAMASGTKNDIYGLWGSSASDVFAVGSAGTVLRYDGKAWSVMSSGTSNDLFGVWGSSATSVFAVGKAGTVLHYDGKAWTAMSNNIPVDLYGVWGSSATSVFAVGGSGAILRYDGKAWTPMTGVTAQDLFGVWGSSADNVFAVGRAGTIVRYDGKAWSQMTSNAPDDLFSVWGSPGADVFAAGKTGVIVRYYADAESWEIMTSHARSDLYVVWGTSSVNVLAAGMSGAVLRFAPPVVTAVSPALGTQGETLDVTIDGKNLTGASSLGFGAGIAVNNFKVLGTGQLMANITIVSGAVVGPRDISVTTPFGVSTLSGGFTVKQALPVVVSVTPAHANQETSINVIIAGANLGEVRGVSFGDGITVNSFAALGPNQVMAIITVNADAAIGVRGVSVTTPGGTSTLPGSFTVKQAVPVVTSVSPNQGARGATLDVTISGRNFSGATEVKLGAGVAVNRFTVVSPNQITVSITIVAGAAIGTREVSVTTPGGTSVLADGFNIKQGLPVITSISPADGSPGDTLDIVINGSNLDGATSVSFGGEIAVNSFSNRSPTQVAARVTISRNATTGARDVSVTTEGGTGVLSGSFTVKEAPLSPVFIGLIWMGVVVVVVAFALVLRTLRRRMGAGPL